MKCKICDGKTHDVFFAKILNKHNIEYYYYDYCGFLQTEEPYWLKEAYNNSISITDTGMMARNIGNRKINNKLFNLLLKFQKFGLFFCIKKKMKSLTMKDMNFLISKMEDRCE